MWPAETVGQSRRFFDAADRDAFLGLAEHGWNVEPNLHFSFMGTHLVWARTDLSVEEYFDWFEASEERFGRHNVEETTLEPVLISWHDRGLLDSATLEDVRLHFFQTRRKHINIIPGFEVSRVWEQSAVQELEESGELEAALIAAFKEPLATWSEALDVMGSTS